MPRSAIFQTMSPARVESEPKAIWLNVAAPAADAGGGRASVMGFSGGAGNDSVIVTAFVANDVFSGGGGFDTIDFRQSGATRIQYYADVGHVRARRTSR